MSLDLDLRQRAMLQEMGVQVWWPAADQALAPAPAAPSVDPSAALPNPVPGNPSRAPASAAVSEPQSISAPARAAAPPQPPAINTAAAGASDTAMAPPPWALSAPLVLFPQADPALTPADLGAGWLLVAQDLDGSDPFAGDAGRLLRNMLHALRLHRHPRVFLCALQTPESGDTRSGNDAAPCTDVLANVMASVQPSVVLVMGRVAARAALGRSEPLGQLRATPHALAGVPAVVTYDATYLLRAPPATKALVWADLCRARALAAGAGAATGH